MSDIIQTNSNLIIAGQVANKAASQNVFAEHRAGLTQNTLKAHARDLTVFAQFLNSVRINIDADSLMNNPHSWYGITWGLVKAFLQSQLNDGFAVGTVNRRLATVRKYAELSFQAGAIDEKEIALIKTVKGYAGKRARNIDEKRDQTRLTDNDGKARKKAHHVSIPVSTARELMKRTDDTEQSIRDSVLMCLLLDHGLRVGEIAELTVGAINLSEGQLTFYRRKVDKVQTHNLSKRTLKALKAYAPYMPIMADAPLLRGSRKGGKLTDGAMSVRAIIKRVGVLGLQHDLESLTPHDCRHYWATQASRNKTDLLSLQQAGGWNSLEMPRRYVEEARIANEGVKLND